MGGYRMACAERKDVLCDPVSGIVHDGCLYDLYTGGSRRIRVVLRVELRSRGRGGRTLIRNVHEMVFTI